MKVKKEIKIFPWQKIQMILFFVIGMLVAGLFFYLWRTPNVSVEQTRETEGYQRVENVNYKIIENAESPTGIVREFSFQLEEEMAYDTTLAFLFGHQNVEVYLGEEKVYSLKKAEELSMIQTPGENCAMIPLYREDMGKEVRVLLTPVYKEFKDQEIEFLVGSKLSIYQAKMREAFPELFLSLADIATGILLLFGAVYFSRKNEKGKRFYALALVAIALGLWNFTWTEFSTFIFGSKTVLSYYISLVMLMISVIPLIKSVDISWEEKTGKMLNGWCVLCGVISVMELVLQWCGIVDLREILKVTHGMIVVSSLVLIISGLKEWKEFRRRPKGEVKEKTTHVWILGVGAMLDMVLYYVKDGSTGLLFVLVAILFYVLLEGMQLFFAYIGQKQMLEEKEVQLTLSRITTLVSQIRSHFVFNILNAISGMCKYDPEKADETVVRFARYLRNNIDIMEDDREVLFSTELAHLEDYVVLEQIRFGDKIAFETEIGTDQFVIPPLILQPVVENAIKHGLTKKQTGGTVILRTWEDGNFVKIAVEDDGVGFDLSELDKEKSVGIKNIRYRLYHLVNGSLDIESQVGVGTVVTITIPKKA